MLSTKTVLGLDLSSVNTGYSIFGMASDEASENSPFQLITFGNITPSSKLNEQAKLETLYNLISNLINEYDIDVVAIEDTYYSANAKTFKVLVRISGVAILAAQKAECEIYLYPPSTIKKAFTGSGKASKAEMIKTAMQIYDIEKGSIEDNAADAIGVGHAHIALTKEKYCGNIKS